MVYLKDKEGGIYEGTYSSYLDASPPQQEEKGMLKKLKNFFVAVFEILYDVFYGEYSHSKNRYKNQ